MRVSPGERLIATALVAPHSEESYVPSLRIHLYRRQIDCALLTSSETPDYTNGAGHQISWRLPVDGRSLAGRVVRVCGIEEAHT
jgi:hypothetical protein